MKKNILFLFLLSVSNFTFAQFPNLVASSNSPICVNNTLNLSASHDALAGGTTATYSWTGPNNFTSSAQNPQRLNAADVDGTYTVTLTLSGTQTGTFTATTAVFKVITPSVTMKSYLQGDNLNVSNNFCAGNNMILEAATDYTSGVSYSWTGPNGFSSTLQAPTISNVTAANAGFYQATITFNNSSCVFVSKRNYEITIGSPRVSISQNQVCSGGNVTLTPVLSPASATVTSYLWEGNNGLTSNSSTLAINNLQERKTYKLTATFGGGCSGTSVAYISPQPMVPTPNVGTRIFNCNANVFATMPTTFAPAELTNYSWAGPNGFTSNTPSPQVTQPGDYTFTGTISGAGCNDVFTRTVTVPRIPSTTNPIINVSIISTSEFTGGTTPSAQSSFCDGIDVILVGTNSGDQFNTISYNWTGPNGFSSTLATPKIPNFSAAKAGVYSLTVTGTGNACSPTATATASNNIYIGHNPAPSLLGISFSNANAPGTAFCSGNTISLTPNLNRTNSNNSLGTYSWTGPNGFSSTERVPRISNVSAANEGVYSVTATFTSGCVGTATASASLNLSTQSSFSISSRRLKFNSANVTSNCLGSTVELIAQTGGSIINSISWTGPNGFSSTALSPQIVNATAANSGYYYATINMGGECPATITRAANITLSNNVLPFTITRVNTDPASDNRSVCVGNNIKLIATPLFSNYYQGTYSWTGPNGFTSTEISPTISNIDASKLGTYTLNVNYTEGCVGTATSTITLNTNPPTLSLGRITPTGICEGSPITLTYNLAAGPDTYAWTGPNGFTSNQPRAVIPSLSAATLGTYTLTVNLGGSCPTTLTATTNLAYDTAPTTTTIRFTEQITSFGGNNQCSGSNIVLSLPFLSSSFITSYQWSGPNGFSSTLANPVVTNAPEGTYSVSVGYLVCGVVNTVTATATLTNTRSVTLSSRIQGGLSASSYCTGSNIELLVNTLQPGYAQPSSYSWSGPNGFSSTAAVPVITNATASNAGVYTLTVNFANPCAGTATATINVAIANYQANLLARRPGQFSNAFTFCSGSTVELYSSNTPSGGTISSYSWTGPDGFSSTAAVPQIANFQAANAGTYNLTVTVSGGTCAGTYSATTTLSFGNPTHSIWANAHTVQCPGGNISLFSQVSGQSYGTGTTYSWTGPNSFTNTSSSTTLTNLQAVNSGVYTVVVNYPNTTGCAASGTATSTIKLAIGNTAANILPNQNQTVAANTNFPLQIELLGGTLPITLNLSNGATFIVSSSNVGSGNIVTVNTSVSSSQTLSISSITSSCGAGTGTGSAVITVPETCPTVATALSRIQGAGTPSTAFCSGTNVELYATFNTTHSGATYSYNWTGPDGFSSTDATPLLSNAQASKAGTYSLTVTFGGSCTGTASSTRTITVANTFLNIYGKRVGSPTISFTFCNGSDIDLVTIFTPTAPTVSSYSWTGPNGFSSTAAVPQIANFQAINNGTYSLAAVVTGECAGTYTASVNLSSTNTITPSIGLSTLSVQCPGGAITFFPQTNTGDFSNGTTYSWSGPNSFSSTSKNPVLTNLQAVNSGIYTLTIVHTSTHGCANYTGTTTLTKTLGVGNTAANILPNQNQTVAANTNFTLGIEILGGTFPMTLNLSNGSSFSVPSTISNTGNIFTANLAVASAQTITISSMTSSCPAGTNTGSAVISIGTPCPTSLPNFSGTYNNGVTQYREASGIITTQAGTGAILTVNSGGKLTLDSGQSILLQPGFEAKTGSVFKAHIDGCGGYHELETVTNGSLTPKPFFTIKNKKHFKMKIQYYFLFLAWLFALALSQPIHAQTQLGADIDGEAADDNSGFSCSLSADGTRLAIGARLNDGNGSNSGHVRVYQWNGTAWVQQGADINGEAANDGSGRSISLSADGTRLAIGAIANISNSSVAGHVRVYQWNGTAWVQQGADIDGEATGDASGQSVSFSADGTKLAIGATGNDGNGSNSGHVRVYQWNGTAWVQQGADIDGEATGDASGQSVSFSADGTKLAIGATGNDGNGSNSGHVRVYQWNGTAWVQQGADIDGEAAGDASGQSVSFSADGTRLAIGATNASGGGRVRVYHWNGTAWVQQGANISAEAGSDQFGISVSLSSDGTRLAIGANLNDGNGNAAGHVRLYQWNGTAWTQIGMDIDGEAAGDRSGGFVSLSADGTRLAIGATDNDGNGNNAGHVRVYAFCSQIATATEEMTWNGSVSTDWSNPCNWSPNGVPTATNPVTILNVANDPIIMSGTTAYAFKIDVGNAASLTINSGGELNVLPTNSPNSLFGINLISNAIFTNNGLLSFTPTFILIFVNDNATFNNTGTANLNSSGRSITMVGPNAMVNNSATGIINLQGGRGIQSINGTTGNVITNQGTINYTGSDYFASLNPGFTLNNSGTIDIKSGPGIVVSGGTLNNLACAKILMPTAQYYDNQFSSVTTNAGLMITGGVQNTNGSFTNNGVLKYSNLSGNAIANATNPSVIVNDDPTPIFSYGGTYNGTISGIFTDDVGTNSAGTFTAPNTFVPDVSLPTGSQTLYAKITPNGGACEYVVPFTYLNGCAQVATATETMTWNGSVSTDWSNPCNWTPNGVPTATNPVIIPATTNDPIISSGTSVARDIEINGSGASLTVSVGATLTLSVEGSAMVVSNSGQLNNRGTINATNTTPTTNSTVAFELGQNVTVDNYGTLNLTALQNNGLEIGNNSTFRNYSGGNVIINAKFGVRGEGPVFNDSGATITITGSSAAILFNGTLTNSGLIDLTGTMECNSGTQIINNACGIIKLTGDYFNSTNATTINNGFMSIGGTLHNNSTGTFTNSGVLKYGSLTINPLLLNSGDAAVVVNNALTPIFTYGGTYNGTIDGIFTAATAQVSESAGTFTAPNTFVPSGSLITGQTLYAKITPQGGACSYVVPFVYTRPFISTWKLDAGTTTLSISPETVGEVAYVWTTVPAGTSGSGVFNQAFSDIAGIPAGATIELSISPTNFRRININNGGNKSKLLEIKQWGDVAWTTMENAFFGCNNLQVTAIDNPNLSAVTNMANMFRGATKFNQDISAWNVAGVTNMSDMFNGATAFNQSLAGWGTKFNANVLLTGFLNNCGMNIANYDATLTGFNAGTITGRSLGASNLKYCTAAADRANLVKPIAAGGKGWTITGDAFISNCRPFITTWNLATAGSGATQLSFGVETAGMVDYTWTTVPAGMSGSGTFSGPTATITGLPAGATIELSIAPANFQRFRMFNGTDKSRLVDIKQWGDVAWTSMTSAFWGCNNMTMSATDVPNTANVTSMSFMFQGCSAYNQALPASFNTANVTNMSGMFSGCSAYNQALPASFNTAMVENMRSMFSGCSAYNQALPANFNTANVMDMGFMFYGCSAYNQALPASFNTAMVTDMRRMFANCHAYNQALPASFNTAMVTDMLEMFDSCIVFNQVLPVDFNTAKVENMFAMFRDCHAYNQALPAAFTTANVENMNQMFSGATAFNQNIGHLDISKAFVFDLVKNSGIDQPNYDAMLTTWNAAGYTNKNLLDASPLKYCASEADRANLVKPIADGGKGWTITGDALLCTNIIYVNHTRPDNSGDGYSWATAKKDVQAALTLATSGKEIWVAKGTYKPTADASGNTAPTDPRTKTFVMKDGVKIYGSFAGTEVNLSERTLAVMAANPAILSGDFNGDDEVSGSGSTLSIMGNAENSIHVIYNNYTSGNPLTATAVLDGFVITGGNANATAGGGMSNSNASPSLSNLTFIGNNAFGGGGMYNFNSNPVLKSITFSNNKANSGGGMDNYTSTPSLTNVSFSGNNATTQGGGMSNIYFDPSLSNVSFFNNNATNDGGAIFNALGASPNISNSIFWGNTKNGNANAIGADIFNESGTTTVKNTLLQFPNTTSNYPTTGDGKFVFPDASNIFAQNSLFVNAADPDGADNIFRTADDGLMLSVCSPAINAGNNADIPSGITTDIVGNPRTFNTTVDMGAYELQANQNIPTLTVGTIPAICSGATSFTIPYTATTGTPTTYTISGTGITTVTDGSLPSGSITVNLSATASGTSIPFTLTVKNASGCTSAEITRSVMVNAAPTATISYTGSPFCKSAITGTVSITGATGGTFSSTAGLTIDATTGAINPSTSTAGTYTVTYSIAASGGCAAVNATTSVTITNNPTASISYTGSPFCKTASAVNVNQTGTSGGTFTSSPAGLTLSGAGQITPSSSTAGTYTITYTIAASGGCAAVTATTSVTITDNPTASISYTGSPFCKTASAVNVNQTGTTGGTFTSSPAGLTLSGAGQITPSSSTAGTYAITYTIAASGGCAALTATTSITITDNPTASISYTGSPFCKTASAVNVNQTGTSGGTFTSSPAGLTLSGAGQITPSSSTAGTYTITYTIAASGGCAAVTATTSVTITDNPTASISYTGSPFCKTASAVNLNQTGTTGGTFTSSPAGLTLSGAGQITPSSSTAGTYTITYTIAASGGCAAVTATTSVTITDNPTASISYTGSPFCKTASAVNVNQTGATGGTFTSSPAGLTLSGAGQITPNSSTAGTYTITYTLAASGGCAAVTATTSVTITDNPTASISYTGSPFCKTASAVNVNQTGATGGTFTSSPAGLTLSGAGQITPSSSTAGTYTITYTLAASGGCAAVTATTSVTITNNPTASISYTGSPFCKTASAVNVNQTGTSGGTFTSSPAGLTLSGAGQITPSSSTAGTYTITYTLAASGGCAAVTATTSVTITDNPTASISYTGSPFCKTASAVNVNQTGTTGGIFTSSPAGLTLSGAGQITPSSSTAGTYTITYNLAASGGCAAVTATTSVTITDNPTASISYTGSPFCKTASAVNVNQTGTTGGTFTSSPAGLTLSGAGQITPSSSTAGTYTITYTLAASGGCAAVTATTSVTISNGPPIINQPQNVSICQGNNATFTVQTNQTGVTYQWEVNTGNGFVAVAASTVYSGENTATLSLAFPPSTYSSYQYRCVVSKNGCTATSEAATLSLSGSAEALNIVNVSPISGVYSQTAVAYTIALNKIEPSANVTYKSGNLIELMPGFETKTGAVFATKIESPCATNSTLNNSFDNLPKEIRK